ncbi:X-Pro dipeptidyl-peptidase [Amycolatopsis arida]|uniref:Xaa-Pro dipeptidyl-peptidase n=1 Tax=Amycolatopsis arida TaxID=587909 RepID=A0A1I5ZH70_9PSEU|nr:Xaa-Pro dipeptidyl-peptidase [Amycolatopsis arida]TDX89675.1 X-Pro dipeptidyl-peptidase [Amycolatopsis arida]SFQ55760.1 X-Pro dipeptidyl-peptidase [Amycolatopsis arida]
MARFRSRTLVTLLATALGTALLPAGTGAAAPPAPTVRDGLSQPIYSYADAIRERVWVDIGLDADRDGRSDRVVVDVIRPAEPARRHLRVPVIMDASPYYGNLGRGNESERKTYDAHDRPLGFPLFYDNYFVPRGYAVVQVDLAGTNRSQGCLDVGGRSDIASGKAVVDWLNGRATGYDDAGNRVRADWSTGAVGMIGKSWDGTIANGVAATGVNGLRTIVPIAAISSWYDYYRSDGVSFGRDPLALARRIESPAAAARCSAVHERLATGAPANGDVTPLWTERDYVRKAQRVKASVFAVHGLGDLNVKTIHLGQWWDALTVPRKLWLSQTGHVDPFDFRRAEWVRTLHRWFDRWLLDVPNGIEHEPTASIERAPDQWVDEPSWPVRRQTTLWPRPGTEPGLGTLGTTPPSRDAHADFTDDPTQGVRDWVVAPDTPSPARVLFDTGPLAADVRVAGTGTITVTAIPSTDTAHLSAMLVDYGPATTRDYLSRDEGIRTLTTESCWGATRPGDDPCYRDTEATTVDVDAEVIARGWTDLANHRSLRTPRRLVPGQPYEITFRLSTTDHVVPAGHHLALIVAGTDRGFIVAPARPPSVRLDLHGTSVRLPLQGVPQPVSGAPARVREDRLPPVAVRGDFVR